MRALVENLRICCSLVNVLASVSRRIETMCALKKIGLASSGSLGRAFGCPKLTVPTKEQQRWHKPQARLKRIFVRQSAHLATAAFARSLSLSLSPSLYHRLLVTCKLPSSFSSQLNGIKFVELVCLARLALFN